MTCALLAVARDEDKYIDEWIQYHLNLGIDHIYICDNNDIDKRLVYNNDNVTIVSANTINFQKDYYNAQCSCYDNVLNNIWDQYDYCAIIDIDEFFQFNDCINIKEFIKKYMIDLEYNVAEIPWVVYDDNDLIFDINKPVLELYPRPQDKMHWEWCKNECSWGKSIFKLCRGVKSSPHWPIPGSMVALGGFKTTHISKEIATVKHYRTKCLEDYMKRKFLNQNIGVTGFTNSGKCIIRPYFDINHINLDKLIWSMRFAKDCGYKISEDDRKWLLNQFNNFPLITVVIRTHNRLNLLKRCCESVFNQSIKCDVLVLDDCSTDDTKKWLAEQNINFFSSKDNLGPGEILAKGKYLINTPYFIILDDDDIWLTCDVVERFYNVIIDNPYADLIYTNFVLHVGHVMSTKVLLDCPNLSLWAHDDWYFDWVKNHSKMSVGVDFNFYGYNTDTISCSYIYDKTMYISKDFYNERDKEKTLEFIEHNYHKSNIREREIFDQIKTYYNK